MSLLKAALLGAILTLTCWVLAIRCSKDSSPNIIIFLVDDLGYGDLSVYGHPTSSTPNINRLANQGLLFTQFYSTAPSSSSSRASLLTGRYHVRSGIYPGNFKPDDLGGLPLSETTIAEGLKSQGYTTALVGNWHLGVGEGGKYLPNHHGFDYYTGIPYSHSDCPCYTCFYPDQRCHRLCDPEYVSCPIFECNKFKQEIIQQPADLTTLAPHLLNSALGFVERSLSKRKPFFLLYSFHHMHGPQFSGDHFTNSSKRGPFGDALREVDYAVGLVMKSLQVNRLEQNTFVFLTSVNGPDLSEGREGGSAGPLRCGKGTTWEGGVRVPAIARWLGKIPARGRSSQLGSHLDLFPTVMKLAKARLPSHRTIDGVEISRLLFHNTKKIRRNWLAYFPEDTNSDEGPHALRLNQYKAHFYTKGGRCSEDYLDSACRQDTPLIQHSPPLLFDLHSDPGESLPLDSTQYPRLLEKIRLTRKVLMDKLEWGFPQTKAGQNGTLQPCGNPHCNPFPFCCHTDSLSFPGPLSPYPV